MGGYSSKKSFFFLIFALTHYFMLYIACKSWIVSKQWVRTETCQHSIQPPRSATIPTWVSEAHKWYDKVFMDYHENNSPDSPALSGTLGHSSHNIHMSRHNKFITSKNFRSSNRSCVCADWWQSNEACWDTKSFFPNNFFYGDIRDTRRVGGWIKHFSSNILTVCTTQILTVCTTQWNKIQSCYTPGNIFKCKLCWQYNPISFWCSLLDWLNLLEAYSPNCFFARFFLWISKNIAVQTTHTAKVKREGANFLTPISSQSTDKYIWG